MKLAPVGFVEKKKEMKKEMNLGSCARQPGSGTRLSQLGE
jgi:hypothetical protein